VVGLPGVGVAVAFGVRLEGEGEGERPMRARWEGVRGMSEIVSFAREGMRGRKERMKLVRRYKRRARTA
jgi:hypothetical protein